MPVVQRAKILQAAPCVPGTIFRVRTLHRVGVRRRAFWAYVPEAWGEVASSRRGRTFPAQSCAKFCCLTRRLMPLILLTG